MIRGRTSTTLVSSHRLDGPDVGTVTCRTTGRPVDGVWQVLAERLVAVSDGARTVESWLLGYAARVPVPEQVRRVWILSTVDGEMLLDGDADIRTLRSLLFMAGELLTDRARTAGEVD